jgi:hypothetical protein
VKVIDAEPLDPDEKVNPVVHPRVNVPWVTLSVSASDDPDAAASVNVIALPRENVTELFTLTELGARTVGASRLTVMATFALAVRVSTRSSSASTSVSAPE